MRGAQSNAQIDSAAGGLSNDTDTHLSKIPIFAPKEEPQMRRKAGFESSTDYYLPTEKPLHEGVSALSERNLVTNR